VDADEEGEEDEDEDGDEDEDEYEDEDEVAHIVRSALHASVQYPS